MTLDPAVLLSLAVGSLSALVPVMNSEAYAVFTAVTTDYRTAVCAAVALAVGQTFGKTVLFETSRRGISRLPARLTGMSGFAAWSRRISGWMQSRVAGPVVVLLSASTGLPPLAIVTVVAGAGGQRRLAFVVLCLVGRVTRYLALVLPVVRMAG